MRSELTIIVPSVEAVDKPIETADLEAIVKADAEKYGVSYSKLHATIQCESNFHAGARSPTHDVGIAQINVDAWPTITEEQMLDPAFSIDFMAQQFSIGHAHYWVCFNRLFG